MNSKLYNDGEDENSSWQTKICTFDCFRLEN
jgi:hypothetical protein